jgi:hypothetical protein
VSVTILLRTYAIFTVTVVLLAFEGRNKPESQRQILTGDAVWIAGEFWPAAGRDGFASQVTSLWRPFLNPARPSESSASGGPAGTVPT